MREQIVERKRFTLEERKQILKKSNGRCAHCGISLNAKSENFSMEHIIPISKGGTHDENNLVALCCICNMEKSNYILNPAGYYKYVNEEYIPGIVEKYKLYQRDNSWFDKKNFFSEDAFEVKIPFSKNKREIMIPIGVFKKSCLDEYDEVYEFVSKYHDKYGLDKSDIGETIDRNYRTGALYVLRNTSGIIAVFPVNTGLNPIFKSGELRYYIHICGIPCLYNKPHYKVAIYITLKKLIMGLCESSPNYESVVEIMCPVKDTFVSEILDLLGPGYKVEDSGDGAFGSRLYLKAITEEGDLKDIDEYWDESKRIKVVDRYSKFLQRALGLKDFSDEKGKRKHNKKIS